MPLKVRGAVGCVVRAGSGAVAVDIAAECIGFERGSRTLASVRFPDRTRGGEEFRAFVVTLGAADIVALEASTNTWALAKLLGRHAGRGYIAIDRLTVHPKSSEAGRQRGRG